MIVLPLFSCKEDINYQSGTYFYLEKTQINFSSKAEEIAISFFNAGGETKAFVVSENSDWCSASVSDDKIIIKATENILARSRTAKIEVSNGGQKILLLVRQAQKYFTYIAAVRNLQAVAGLGEITLKWQEPVEDNFSHVVIRFVKSGELQEITIKKGITEHTIKELRNGDGEYEFSLQSIDHEGDLGEIVKISATAGKLVAMRFEDDLPLQWLPYYLKTSDIYTTTLKIGSIEFNRNEPINIVFEADPTLLAAYNQENGTDVQLLPRNSYTLPDNYKFLSLASYQEMQIEINTSHLKDRTRYGLPLRIKSAEPATISDIKSSTLILFNVEDLAGWYTVDRLPKCGEGAGNYPANPEDRRRYIKRTGDTTWETGYLFRSYVNNEEHTGSGNAVQYIRIDPVTKKIYIQQGNYAVSNSLNTFDLTNNELHIEYEYSDWAGWWTHEKMHRRSIKKQM